MLKMLKLLKDRIRNFVQRQIIKQYNNNKGTNNKQSYEDAAFLVFLDGVLVISYALFSIFAFMSFYFLIKKEILPIL